MSRYDKYDNLSGGFRAPLDANQSAITGNPLGVGVNSTGEVVVGAGVTGVVGVMCVTRAMVAGDVIDVMTAGEIVEFTGAAGTVYFAHATTGVISATPSEFPVGYTVEATRLIVRTAGAGISAATGSSVVGDQANIVALTDSTTGTANNTLEALPNPTDTPATADALRDDLVAVLIPALRNNFADLAAKVNTIISTLDSAGITV